MVCLQLRSIKQIPIYGKQSPLLPLWDNPLLSFLRNYREQPSMSLHMLNLHSHMYSIDCLVKAWSKNLQLLLQNAIENQLRPFHKFRLNYDSFLSFFDRVQKRYDSQYLMISTRLSCRHLMVKPSGIGYHRKTWLGGYFGPLM